MAKFSVKKPLTVFVAVVAILVLGVVSFMNMTPDLLPNINLPYVMVMTPVPGSTPEKVETTVTKPLEQSMASLEHIESVSSTSGENSSLIFLEFSNDVNLDTITVDILQRTTQMAEYWDDTVGTPVILKLNPSMLPVMVLAVDNEGMDTEELSRFTEEQLLSDLEGVPGVASVEASGLVADEIQVALRQERIDALNREVRRAIDAQFEETEEELEEGREEVEEGLDEVEAGLDELDAAVEEAADMAANAQTMMAEAEAKAMQQILQQVSAWTREVLTLDETERSLRQYEGGFAELDQAAAELQSNISQLEELEKQLGTLSAIEAQFAAQIAAIQNDPALSDAEKQQQIDAVRNSAEYRQMEASLAGLDAALSSLGTDRQTLSARLTESRANLTSVEASITQLNAELTARGLNRETIGVALREIEENRAKLNAGIAQLQGTLSQLQAGSMTAAQAEAELERQKMKGILQFSEGTTQLLLAQSELNNALVQIDAGLERIDEERQAAYDRADLDEILSLEMLSQILFADNFSMPAGYVAKDGVQTLVRVGDAFQSVEELEDLVVLDLPIDDLDPIYLTDVADVNLVSNSGNIYAKINGNDGVLLSLSKQSTFATAEVSDNIRDKLDELGEEYPGLSYVSLMDQGDYIRVVINAILQNLLLGAIFAIIVLFLFLRDIRPTFITLCSIPISVIFAIALMYFSGVTINIISLSGLAVGVGMLVDNSVVVIENIYRLRSKGENAVKAAVSGATQVSGAITASTLTTICVFVPIVFTEGITRQLFTDMALTLAYSLMASLVVALTLVPAMSSGLLQNDAGRKSRLLVRVQGLYEKIVSAVLNRKVLVLVSTLVLLVGSVFLIVLRGYIFMPEMDMPEAIVNLTAPEGSTTEDTMEYADDVSERLLELEGVETVGAMLSSTGTGMFAGGTGGESNDEDTQVTMYLLLGEKESGIETSRKINEMFEDYPCEVQASGASSMSDYMDALGGSGLSVDVYGEDQDGLLQAARQVAETLEGLAGTQNVLDGIGDTEPEIRFVVDKNLAAAEGLTVAQVYTEVNRALSTENTATSITLEEGETDVIVLSANHNAMTPDSIRNFSFMHENALGEKNRVYLRDIATIVETETTTAVNRLDQRRYITVSAEVGEGYNVGLISTEAERALEDLNLPSGVSYEVTGENTTILDAFEDLALMLLLGILLVYLIMVAQFQSLKSPFIVMFTIPLAFTGGLLGLLVTGMEISVIAAIGFVMLVGIIVNNGIVLVDYINQLRAEGMETRAAIIEAGKTRMRPILMTSTTTILGLSVMALGTGTGGELMQPIAIVCIGGLVYATLLTLFVVPIMYELLNRKKFRVIDEEDLKISEL
ncbi:efflux RND transporter permease subunit [Ruminococcaceae bacterium OttesenSCG-928-I18]|nr:efflux RND transporter permease subunit [Ruminococcaceae bacterium OttesenSCG-928-I18]